MKKFLSVIIFSLILCSNVVAETCGYTWSIGNNPDMTPSKYARIDFKNDTEYVAKVSGYTLYTQSEKIVRDRVFKKRSDGVTPEPKYIKPNSEYWITFGHGADWPWDIIKKASIKCEVLTFDQYEDELLGISNSTKTTNTNQSAAKFNPRSGYYSLLILAGIIIAGLLYYIKSLNIKNKRETKVERLKSPKSKSKKSNYSSQNFILTVWNGEESMSKIFWLYCVLIVVIVSFISGMILNLLGNIIWIIPISVIIWTNTGLWRSSSIYQNQKLKNKQSYGWATAAKVYVVLNYITTISQIGLSLSI